MDTPSSVVVAIDFSPCSLSAFQQAARLAAWTRASLIAVHVVPAPVFGAAAIDALTPGISLSLELPNDKDLMAEARERWKAFARAAAAPSTARFETMVGNPRADILDTVRRTAPELLVIGAYGELGLPGELGPTASACVQRSPSDVLVVREGRTGPFRSVVACIDFTPISRLVVDRALRIAAQDSAALRVLHTYEDPWRGREPRGPARTVPDFKDRYAELVARHMRHFCEPMAHELSAAKADFRALESASHGRGIVEFLKQSDGDLVVMGTSARWNVHDFVWGSTAERVMRTAPCSALAVKPPAPS